jgi:hypothetical protein
VPDVEEIRADVDIVQKDIEVMRKVAEARQTLADKINKLTELTAKGNALKKDPFANALSTTGVADGESIIAILQEMGEYIKTPDDAPEGHLAKITTDDIWHQEAGAPVTLPDGTKGYSMPAIYRINAEGDVDEDTMVTPEVAGTQQVIDDSYEPLLSNSWNGTRFIGKNAGYLKALVGHGGQPIGLDHIPPAFPVVLSSAQKQELKKIAEPTTTSSLNKMLQQHLRENYRKATMSGKNPWEVSPGLFIRPKTDADALYEEMVTGSSSTPGSATAFFAAASVHGGTQYDPYRGFAPKGDLTLPVSVNDILSRGAYSEIQNYNKKHGIESNPYANFGKTIAPVIAEVVSRTRPGQNVTITASDIEKAKQSKSLGFKGEPVTAEGWKDLFARSEASQSEYIRASLVTEITGEDATPAPTDLFVMCGLNARDTQIFGSKMMANSTRLSQNNKTMFTQACLLEYNREALEAVVALSDALEEEAQATSAKNIIEMLPAFRDQVQNTILVLQNRIGQLQAQLDSLLKDRNQTLTDRQAVIEDYRQQIAKGAKAEVEALLMRISATNM